MAYVPGFEHDLFLSYACDDSSEWTRAFEESLRQQLQERLGDRIHIWQDKDKIRFGQSFPDQIQHGLHSSAGLLAVVSPNYRGSEWCADERKCFIDHCNAANRLKAGAYYRFLKVIKTPWPGNDHEQFYPELQHINFFERRRSDEVIEDITEFVPGTQEFRTRIAQAAQAIGSMLEQMRRSRESVYIAGTTRDASDARKSLRNELRARGYDVRPDGPIDEGFSSALIKKELQPALLSAHILGGTYDAFIDKQIDLALELDKRLVFWITREAESTQDARQKQLIDGIKGGRRQQDCEWLNSRSAQAFAEHLLEKLKPRPSVATANGYGQGKARIYLLCDPTTPEDAGFARDLQSKIREHEGMVVELPVADSPAAFHNQMLRDSEGLLLYRNAAPERWLYENAQDIVHAENLNQRRRPCDSKGFLLTDPSVLKGSPIPMFKPSPQPNLADIEPFLAKLRQAGGANAA